MKFVCKSNDLQRSVSIVEKAISSKTNLPVLENLYLELADNQLRLRGHDLEIGIEHTMCVDNMQSPGQILVKCKTLSSILAKLVHDELSISVEKNKMIISTPNVDFDILCMSAEEYPVFPNIEAGVSFNLSCEQFRDLAKHTLFSASMDETKHFLNGVLMKNEENALYFVATDGFRLALKQAPLPEVESRFEVIVPYKAMNEVSKIVQTGGNEDLIKLTISDNQIVFNKNETVVISRVVKGQFPDYKQVLPKDSENIFTVSRRQLIEASERASIIAQASNNVVRFSFQGDETDIVANAPSMGDFKERITMTRTQGNDDIKIAFNVRLILEALKILEQDTIIIELGGGLSPCLIRPEMNDDYQYVIMPIRTNEYKESPAEAVHATG